MTIPLIGLGAYPGRLYSNIAPFSATDGATYLDVLQELRNYIVNQLVPYFDGEVGSLSDDWVIQVDRISLAVATQLGDQAAAFLIQIQNQDTSINTNIADQDASVALSVANLTTYVNNAVDSIINSSITLNDTVMTNAINLQAGTFRAALINLINAGRNVANGVAPLDASSLVPNANIPDIMSIRNGYNNVKLFGAVGDNVADDTTAIRAAITASASGGTVFFPKGVYKVTSTIVIPDGVTLVGVNTYSSTIMTNQPTGDVFTMASASTLERLSVRSSVLRTAGAFVLIIGSQCRIDFVSMAEYFVGIKVGVSGGVKAALARITRCVFTGTSTIVDSGGIFACNFAEIKIAEITMTGPSGALEPTFGIRVWEGDTWFIDTVNIVSHGVALLVDTPAGKSAFAGYIVNGMFDSPWTSPNDAAPDACRISPLGFVYDTQFSNCWFGGSNSGSGLFVYDNTTGTVDGVSVSNSLAVKCNSGFRFVGAKVKNWSIVGGLVSGNVTNGIWAQQGTSLFSITGVRAGNSGVHGTNGIGISIEASAITDYVITGNNLKGNSGAGIADGATGAPNRIVANNLI